MIALCASCHVFLSKPPFKRVFTCEEGRVERVAAVGAKMRKKKYLQKIITIIGKCYNRRYASNSYFFEFIS